MSALCRGCGAAIVWTETEAGKSAPIDAAPNPDGQVVLSQPDDPREPMRSRVLKKNEQAPMPRYTNHFSTCPKATLFRFGQVPR